ncbi:PGR5-like protein 1B, chloroplastic isoform X2 [Telopea speciosissima]|uniref:PGR5-like protein 1B, chloroplastic isoform X1 n=1 Tax=Telopea speciosissima TaxID=54955 RepID=UPI001CC3D7BF|nr:PGR5-like protein 1B, chloroplastic isoform X1 [Telopea speciosissima]XP_043716204.1 PGR5-like protein 1B, chloroplastic isoform X1 [Telopea speciosissima]XP_043716205.1 PGR5-like protein 1B, chloroplastic isoform X1 [Telopea speciosissima]XP_043716206.1 PGR5-like protein 1B, chloroplastic isoform X1 [Telopea speciosissima]XP_043716208.1 PGR5-like protein 1B, chloroplastic isoform X2 [Telopea speciosissima]
MLTELGFSLSSSRLLSAHIRRPFVSLSSSRLHSSQPASPHNVSLQFFGRQWLSPRRRLFILSPKATDQQGQVKEDEAVDSKILPYCNIDKKGKKTLGELEQEFLQALQAFYYEGKAIMSNEEFDNLKEELMWEGSSVVMLSSDEQKFLEASMAYVAGKPILTDEEYDQLKIRLKTEGSEIVVEGPRCSLRSRKVYSDLTVDYFKMFLLNVPAAVIALTLFFFLDDLTGFEITYLLELPEPFSFIFTWFAALPLILWIAQSITNAIVKDFSILKGPCPNCGTENVSFFGTILSVSSGGSTNNIKCSNCGTELIYDSGTRLITLPEPSEA